MRGVLVLNRVGSVEWRRVIGKREVGIVRLGRERRFGRMARGCDVVGVRISLEAVSMWMNRKYRRYIPRADKIEGSEQEASNSWSGDCNTQRGQWW
jgi:hypothetical protein